MNQPATLFLLDLSSLYSTHDHARAGRRATRIKLSDQFVRDPCTDRRGSFLLPIKGKTMTAKNRPWEC
jgi:hypothetical protein